MTRAALTPNEQRRYVRDHARSVVHELLSYEIPAHYGADELRLLVAARFARTVTRSIKAPPTQTATRLEHLPDSIAR